MLLCACYIPFLIAFASGMGVNDNMSKCRGREVVVGQGQFGVEYFRSPGAKHRAAVKNLTLCLHSERTLYFVSFINNSNNLDRLISSFCFAIAAYNFLTIYPILIVYSNSK